MILDLKHGRQVVRLRKARKDKTFHRSHFLGMNDDLWDKVRGLGSESLKGCEFVELLMVLTCLR